MYLFLTLCLITSCINSNKYSRIGQREVGNEKKDLDKLIQTYKPKYLPSKVDDFNRMVARQPENFFQLLAFPVSNDERILVKLCKLNYLST